MPTRSVAIVALITAGCGTVALAGDPAAYSPESFESLPDVTVCVVDRAAESGLRELTAKRAHDGRSMLLVGGRVVPLEDVHAPGIVAGYAAAEPWFTGDSISVAGGTYVKAGGERRIEATQITRVGDYEAIPVFASTSDQLPPEAVYLPTRPGCVFQAYVRSDLM